MHAPQSELASLTADILARVRLRDPPVHCIANAVAQAFTANLLLAVGALSLEIPPSLLARADEVIV